MSKVWFIRHGESVSNANLPTTHPADSALTPRGHREAVFVAQAFTKPPDLIVVSPYIRALETAVPTQKRFPKVPVQKWNVYEYTYLHPERYNGTTGHDRGPLAQAYWQRSNPFEKEMGEGESFAELLKRVKAAKEKLEQQPNEFIAVFSHGLFLRALLWTLIIGRSEPTAEMMNRYKNFAWGVWLPNGAIWEVNFVGNGRVHFTGFNISHLPANG
ncbi:MAG: histidine phosphatase family protein [Chloroflexi bacterium]|nr:histidine phosphatase family protein [Chloroflexota bacterium]